MWTPNLSSVSVVPSRSRTKIYEFRNFKGINVEQLKLTGVLFTRLIMLTTRLSFSMMLFLQKYDKTFSFFSKLFVFFCRINFETYLFQCIFTTLQIMRVVLTCEYDICFISLMISFLANILCQPQIWEFNSNWYLNF
jgi:hypothetical protein